MRLRDVERGDTLFRRLLIRFISRVSGMRLPDAVRVIWYRKQFFGGPMGAWTHAAMRGPSAWSVGERELMATVVSAANKTAFCTRAHRAIATRVLDGALVEAALDRGARSSLSPGLQATLEFLEKLTVRPEEVTAADARAVLASGVAAEALEDAVAVASIFNIIDRYADALDFEVPSEVELARAAARLLARGYAA